MHHRLDTTDWHVVAEGALKRLEYDEKHHRSSIVFEGGAVLYGIRGRLKNPGTVVVRLFKSRWNTYRLEKYE